MTPGAIVTDAGEMLLFQPAGALAAKVNVLGPQIDASLLVTETLYGA